MTDNNKELQPGTIVAHTETGEEGFLLGSFVRKGERWWTAFWKEAGTLAFPESDIK